MRVSVPAIPPSILSTSSAQNVTTAEAIQRLSAFVTQGNVSVLTGAGVSVDSGIRAYRGHDGRYMNPNYKPIFYHELMEESAKGYAFRQRYWLRSYLGYPPVRDALPNTTHFALAALQYSSCISNIITQNVDGLHHKALEKALGSSKSLTRMQQAILELHGTLHSVRCRRGHLVNRDTFQHWLSTANPNWQKYALRLEETGEQPRTNPDGDVSAKEMVAIEHLGMAYTDFVIPDCPSCAAEGNHNAVHKPEVTFFGESIPIHIKEQSFHHIESSDRLLIMGTTLATYSAFRLFKHALELQKPVMLLNVGPTRADNVPGVDKIDIPSGSVMREVAKIAIGLKSTQDPIITEMLRSGIVKPPKDDY